MLSCKVAVGGWGRVHARCWEGGGVLLPYAKLQLVAALHSSNTVCFLVLFVARLSVGPGISLVTME